MVGLEPGRLAGPPMNRSILHPLPFYQPPLALPPPSRLQPRVALLILLTPYPPPLVSLLFVCLRSGVAVLLSLRPCFPLAFPTQSSFCCVPGHPSPPPRSFPSTSRLLSLHLPPIFSHGLLPIAPALPSRSPWPKLLRKQGHSCEGPPRCVPPLQRLLPMLLGLQLLCLPRPLLRLPSPCPALPKPVAVDSAYVTQKKDSPFDHACSISSHPIRPTGGVLVLSCFASVFSQCPLLVRVPIDGPRVQSSLI